ncbi:alpha-N-acetylgalactosaminide alpha-2,6-sialyltransferase 1-like [Nematolebias whitei]|uniref:alpha-N-acetylgalactosaminide alpha-2,6-sialyltransferase 1-like n=1 Tax=Nematolebias whitei TaxID=451745 RepID=UPI001898A63E|nr:alpha-N-acetylgalactosaminide alpha-2,6-sialyltransferase 1-like [Nematolebias whitei]
MAIQSIRLFSLLTVILASIFIFILMQEHLPETKSWPVFLRFNTTRGENRFIKDAEFWLKKGELRPSAQSTKSLNTTTPVPETPIPIILKESFKKLPQWDFEDIYNQDVPPRLTTCIQSLRNSKDNDFQKAFLPNIRLYLHRDSINMSEWNRLSHFNNPFGFMQMKHDEVMAALKLIPKPNEPLLLPRPGGDGCMHCAVVGTGGILNGSKMGAEIDAHDYVFRVNGAAIKGYEEDVGNRTSVYVHTSYSISSSVYLLKKYGYKSAPHDEGIKYVLIPEGDRDYLWLQRLLQSKGGSDQKGPITYYSGQFNESRFYVLHQDFLRYIRNRFLKSRTLNTTIWSIVRPTNGAFTIFLALHTCDTVRLFQFYDELEIDFFKDNKLLTKRSSEAIQTQYEWLFINQSVTKETDRFHHNQPEVVYTIMMKRRSSLYVANFLLPVLFFLCLDFASLLMSEGGDKIGFKVTVLLAVTVMQLILNEILPVSSDSIPLIDEQQRSCWRAASSFNLP